VSAGPSAWTASAIATLRALWAKGASAGAIAAELRISRNAVIGKARRLKLEARDSPILSAPLPKTIEAKEARAAEKWQRAERAKAADPAPQQKAATPDRSALPAKPAAPLISGPDPAPVPAPSAPPAPPAPPAPLARQSRPLDDLDERRGCRWPEGDPGAPGFRFCCAPTALGRSYCGEHHAVAWHRKPMRLAVADPASYRPTHGQPRR